MSWTKGEAERRRAAYEAREARHVALLAKPNYGRVVPDIEQERLDQMSLALKLRRQGLTYKEIGKRVLTTLANRHGRLKTPHVRSQESVRRILEEARGHEQRLAKIKGTDDPAVCAYIFALELETRPGSKDEIREAWLVAEDAQQEDSWWVYREENLEKTRGEQL